MYSALFSLLIALGLFVLGRWYWRKRGNKRFLAFVFWLLAASFVLGALQALT